MIRHEGILKPMLLSVCCLCAGAGWNRALIREKLKYSGHVLGDVLKWL